MGAGRATLVLVAAVSAARLLALRAELPDRVATHFDGAGRPNGWMTAQGFVLFQLGLLALLVAVFAGMPVLLRRLPARLVNLPNRDYWLAPERRAASIERMGERLAWMGLATVLFFVWVEELVLHANLAGGGRLAAASFAVGLGGYVVVTAGWLIAFHRAFRVPRR